MKILHVISELGTGGAEAVVQELAGGQVSRGHEVGVVSAGGRREAVLRRAGVQVHQAPIAQRSALRSVLALGPVSRAGRPRVDVVHAHNVRATVVAHAGVRHLRAAPPLLATFHGVAEADYPMAARLLSRCSEQVVAVSSLVAERLRAAGLRHEPVVIRNAVSAPAAHDRGQAREALGLDDDIPVALCVARVAPQKRHDVLLQAWELLRTEAVLLCAGDGPLMPELRAAAAQTGGRVLVLGDRPDVPVLLAAADLLVLASDWEGLPMAVLEGMAAGLPVVATDVDGLREAVGDQAGMLVPARSPWELASALDLLLADADARATAGAAARARVAERHSLSQMLQHYEDAYRRLLASA